MGYGDWETRSDSFISTSCWPVAWILGIYNICTNTVSWSIFYRSSMGNFLTVLCQTFNLLKYKKELVGFKCNMFGRRFWSQLGIFDERDQLDLSTKQHGGQGFNQGSWKSHKSLCSQQSWLFSCMRFFFCFPSWSSLLVLHEGAITLCMSCPHSHEWGGSCLCRPAGALTWDVGDGKYRNKN